jgi:hypothetical protein
VVKYKVPKFYVEELVIGKNLTWMDGFPSAHEPTATYRQDKKRSDKPKWSKVAASNGRSKKASTQKFP